MRKKSKVSIITVVYNGAKTIEKTIQSVLRQTYDNIEYIIIDGMSTDGTQKIVEKYENFIACFVSEKDEGLYHAMNKGICRATGDIIGIINSDDWYTDTAVEKVVNYFENNDVDLLYGKVWLVDREGNLELSAAVPLESLWYQMAIPHQSAFVKKKIYDKFGGYNLDYAISADYDLMLRCYSKKVKFGFLDDALAYFFIGGLSSNQWRRRLEEEKDIFMKHSIDCPDRVGCLEKLEERCEWETFSLSIEDNENKLLKLLCVYFNEKVSHLIIFGAGRWGKKCYALLKEKADIDLFVDNDSLKWNQTICGIKIVSPEELSSVEAKILIANKKDGGKIKQQLQHISNCRLNCVSLEELKNL